VIAAILLERNLQNVANYLIVSLAVADLMVACLVMPLGAVYEVIIHSTQVIIKYFLCSNPSSSTAFSHFKFCLNLGHDSPKYLECLA